MAEESKLPNYTWIKFKLEYLNDPEFMQSSDGAVGTFLKLYLLAGKADAQGLIANGGKACTPKDISWLLRTDAAKVEAGLSELIETGLIRHDAEGYWIANFLEEQGPGDNVQRVKWRERQEKHRENITGKDKKREEKKEKEIEIDTERDIENDGDEINCHGDVTVTTPTLSPATTLLEKLETRGGMFLWPGDVEIEKPLDPGISDVYNDIRRLFVMGDIETKDVADLEGYFYLSASEIAKIGGFFADYPRTKSIDGKFAYEEIQFDRGLFGAAVELYFWRWHFNGRKKFDVSEVFDLFGRGESYISAEINRHPEYYRDRKAVRLVADVTRQPVPEELYPDIYEMIGSRSNHVREYLTACWVKWRSKNYRQNDFSVWLFEWFKNGVDLEAPRQVEYSTR